MQSDGYKMKLYNADCIDVLNKMPDDSVSLLLTDPPYNLGNFMKDRDTNLRKMRENFFGAAGWDNDDEESWKTKMDSFFSILSRIMKPKSNVIIFMAIIKASIIIELAKKYGFYYKTTGIWHKTNPMPRNMNLHFINSTETWIYFTYGGRTGTFNNHGRAVHDFFETSITPVSERKFGTHPTQKPVVLLSQFIELLSNPEDTVCDPFMGSGSTGVAALKTGRNFVGIEIEKHYFNIAKKRILGDRP